MSAEQMVLRNHLCEIYNFTPKNRNAIFRFTPLIKEKKAEFFAPSFVELKNAFLNAPQKLIKFWGAFNFARLIF